MINTIINTNKINESDIIILSAPYEKTTSSRKGTKNGPEQIIKCLDYKLEFFDPDFKCEPNNLLKVFHKEIPNINNLSPEDAVQAIFIESEKLYSEGKFIFLLGGEHSVSLGNLKALSKIYKPEDVTILQLDAHCDLRDDDSDYDTLEISNFAHSCVMRRVNELGYKIIQVGIRTYSIDEYEYFSNPDNNIKVFDWRIQNKPKIDDIINSIKTKYVYISIDVDGFDPSQMPGTGTPVQGGLNWEYGVDLIKSAINKKELIGADIVEVAPMNDSVLTEYGAAQLLYTIISNKFRNKLI